MKQLLQKSPVLAGLKRIINNGPAPVCAGSLLQQWKPLFIMIPMWASFLVFGLVQSAGGTFFTEQAITMDWVMGITSIYTVLLIRRIIRFASSRFSTRLLKNIPKPLKTQGIMVRIWVAMVLSIFCCSVAWRVEVRRLQAIAENQLCGNQDTGDFIPMSIMWLVPQFCLLGLMEGIGKDSLEPFFKVWVSDESMEKYASAINEAVIGLGSFFNSLLVFHLKSWFKDTLNCSQLDNYYQTLTVVSFVNGFCRFGVLQYYSDKETKDD